MKYKVRQKVLKGPVKLIGKSGTHYGFAYCPPGGRNPIFISPGHKISMEGCLAVLQKFGPPYRIPLALRHADLMSRDMIRSVIAHEAQGGAQEQKSKSSGIEKKWILLGLGFAAVVLIVYRRKF